MNREILYEILNSRSEKLSNAEIESIMNEELDKSPDEMDTDLVELCLEALSSANEKQLNKKKHHIRISRVLIAAVIFVLVIGISIPAFAKFFSINVPEGIVTIYKECFNVDISNDKYVNDIVGQLEQDGIDNVALPKFVYYTDTKITDYMVEDLNDTKNVDFDFEYNDINGHILLVKHYSKFDDIVKQENLPFKYDNMKNIQKNNVDIFVSSSGNHSQISYVFNNTEYYIPLDCDFETACQIAETI